MINPLLKSNSELYDTTDPGSTLGLYQWLQGHRVTQKLFEAQALAEDRGVTSVVTLVVGLHQLCSGGIQVGTPG